MLRSTLAKRAALLFFLGAALFYLYGLGHLPLLGPDEPRYAQVAREMYLRGDFVTPTLGGHTWFEKPALLYWAMAASYHLFGFTEWAARLGPALCGLLTAFFLYLAGKRDEEADPEGEGNDGLGLWSALAWATSLGAITFSRAASFDVLVTMTVALALSCFYAAEVAQDDRRRRLNLAGFYAGVGASLIAKGLVGFVVPFGVVGLYFLLRREWPRRRLFSSLLWGLPLSLAVASLWYGPVIARNGWTFVDEFFVQHHFARYVSNKYHHPQPVYFYLPIMVLLTLPWTGYLVASLWSVRRWFWRGARTESKLMVFALSWLVAPMVFFSFSGSKLPAYVLPALPGAAILVGERLNRYVRGESGEGAMRATAIIALLLAAGGIYYSLRTGTVPAYCALLVALPLALAAGFAALRLGGRALRLELISSAVFVSIAVAITCGVGAIARQDSVRDLIHQADARGYSAAPIFYMLSDDRTAEFYGGGRVVYDDRGEPFRFDGAFELEDAVKKRGGPALVIIETRWEKQLTGYAGIKAEFVGSNGPQSLFVVSAP